MVEHCREGWVQLKIVGTRAHAPDGVDGLRLKALHTSIRHRPSREAHDRGSHVLMGRQGGGVWATQTTHLYFMRDQVAMIAFRSRRRTLHLERTFARAAGDCTTKARGRS